MCGEEGVATIFREKVEYGSLKIIEEFVASCWK